MKKGAVIAQTLVLGIALLAARPLAADRPVSARAQDRITREVRHELVMLPYYSVFDDLKFQVRGDTVTLLGDVTWPTLKSDAEHAVKKVEGVNNVINQIQVLPLSPMDDRIRRAVFYALYSQNSPLMRYGTSAIPSIHIIVKNGRVTLTGVVNNESDKNIAGMLANRIPGIFAVKNDLSVERG